MVPRAVGTEPRFGLTSDWTGQGVLNLQSCEYGSSEGCQDSERASWRRYHIWEHLGEELVVGRTTVPCERTSPWTRTLFSLPQVSPCLGRGIA